MRKDPIDKLLSLEIFGIKLGLDNLRKFLSLLGNPERKLKYIHVAGTNGKGSVCAILSKALEKANFKIGFFSSPHLISVRERIRFNNNAISEEDLSSIIEELWPTIEFLYKENINITFFETTVVIAIKYFLMKGCDFVIWETGMGGRLDGTNVVKPIITAITTIDFDHQHALGNTLEEIAREKAGIIKENIPLFLGNIPPEPLKVIEKIAAKKHAPCHYLDRTTLAFSKTSNKNLSKWKFSINPEILPQFKGEFFDLALPGLFQLDNTRIAFSILKYLSESYDFDLKKALRGVSDIKWHARVQILPDGKILDGAHNIQGVRSIVATIKDSYFNDKFVVIFGCMEERNPKEAIIALSEISDEFIFVTIKTSRKCFNPEEIIRLMSTVPECHNKKMSCATLDEALIKTKGLKTLISGSLYLAGEVLSKYYTQEEIFRI